MKTMKAWVDGLIVDILDDRPEVTPEAPEPASWTPLEFMERFTYEERVALRALAKNDPMAEDWLDLLRASQEVRLDDPRTMAGLNFMVLRGVLTYQRVAEITSA